MLGWGAISPYSIRYLNDANGTIKNITIKNNIIDPQHADSYFIDIPDSRGYDDWNADFVCDYNIWGDSVVAAPFNWPDSANKTYAQWLAAKCGDTNSVQTQTDPGLNATYYPDSVSDTCVDIGIDLSGTGFDDDKAGTSRPQGSAWDIGCYEFVQ